MTDEYNNDPLLDMFLFETSQLIEQLEQTVLSNEQENCQFTQDSINEIFCIMHTIKGSSAIMAFDNISSLAHTMEDIFYYLREEKPRLLNFSELSDLLLSGVDFIKSEVDKIKDNLKADGDASGLIISMNEFLAALKINNTSANNKDNSYKKASLLGNAFNVSEDYKSVDGVNTPYAIADKNNDAFVKNDAAYEDGFDSNPEEKLKYEQECNCYSALLYFDDGCEMENIRAYNVIRNLSTITDQLSYFPDNLKENDDVTDIIRRDGFRIFIKTDYTYDMLYDFLMQTIFLRRLELKQLNGDDEIEAAFAQEGSKAGEQLPIGASPSVSENLFLQHKLYEKKKNDCEKLGYRAETIQADLSKDNDVNADAHITEHLKTDIFNNENYKADSFKTDDPSKATSDIATKELKNTKSNQSQSIISVSVTKLDKLMDLIGEMVISEAMVVQNPELKGLELENFQKAARQLNKITVEMQDLVMSIRMVPLSATFNKMHRVVRDMRRKLGKEVRLEIIGDTTEVDKNIIEHISDPLMHLVRNAIDHGIEDAEVRLQKGKERTGTITLEAKNAGSDVLIIVRDDGRGLDRARILQKAKENRLLTKNENEMSDKEIVNLVLLPGFSTKSDVTEFSGRGVGMDVVAKNIEEIGGSVSIESLQDKGTQITLKIPLTLAIIDGMNIRVGDSCFTVPLMSIKESFRPGSNFVFSDTDNNEMIMVRGLCYPIVRLHRLFGINAATTELSEGIIIMVEQGENIICLFADELLGQQQVVVKAMPEYIQRFKKVRGLSGCTLLGDGSISLIIDVAGLINM